MIIINEHSSNKYAPRTYANGKIADVTVAIATDLTTPGEITTKKASGSKYVGFLYTKESSPIDFGEKLGFFLKGKSAKTLNVAGNGIYTLAKFGVTQDEINEFVTKMIFVANKINKIEKIYTGGQTGVDIAGAVAAFNLNIPADILMPKGFIQRDSKKIDWKRSKDDIIKQIKQSINLEGFYE